MRFWDSSAIVPLLVKEASSSATHQLLAEDRDMTVWWSSEVECLSALTKLERARQISPEQLRVALNRLTQFAAEWHEIIPLRDVRETAKRFLRLHALSAADALQLAAAMLAAENDPASMAFVSLDARLADAASRQGFNVVIPAVG